MQLKNINFTRKKTPTDIQKQKLVNAECSFAPKAFTASSILRTHIRQHSGERPFKCKHCGKAFASHAAHDSHVRRTHARDKPYPCELCSAAFHDQQELQYHMKGHKSKGNGVFFFFFN